MATTIAARTYIAFTTEPFAASPSWEEVSSDVLTYDFIRGRQYDLDRFEAGTARVLLKNLEGEYWPDNSSGSHYGYIDVRKKIKIARPH